MNRSPSDEKLFHEIAAATDENATGAKAPSTVKARLYSAILERQQETGPLLGLPETKAQGRGLCVFEELVRIAPIQEGRKAFNCCRMCHARVLAENFDDVPLYWASCPYSGFQKP